MSVLTEAIIAGLAAAGVSESNPPMTRQGGGLNGVSITKTTSGAQTILAAVDYARMVVGYLFEVTEDYADNTGTQSSWLLGDTDTPDRWQSSGGSGSVGDQTADGPFTGSSFSNGCILAAGKAMIVTCTPAVGDGTGGCKIVAIAVRAP